ncbi:MAG: HAMP domain-containing histidine kinase [Prevotella sp.]|nr:HAMP domain-containing histidine kinase [Prevotella sp.]
MEKPIRRLFSRAAMMLLVMVLAVIVVASCAKHQRSLAADDDGYNSADSIVSVIGDTRDFPRLLAVTDSLERNGELSQVRAIFYSTVAYNLMGQHRSALNLYYKLANIDAKDLTCQADIESFIYSSKDYVRLLCDMRRYDRALHEAYSADRKLKAAGYSAFVDHHDIAQMIGESQLYLDQAAAAAKSFEKSLQSMKVRLSVNNDPLDLLECQKTMNAIARAYIHTRRYDEAAPWIQRQDSLYVEADNHPRRDSVFVDEMKAEINYSKALLAHAQGRNDDAERAFGEYMSTQLAKNLGSIINSCEYLLESHRYEEAAQNYTQLDRFLLESGYKCDLENIGRYMLPKYRANLLAGHRDTALYIANVVAEYYDTALVRQKIIDADLLSTIYDTEGKERQIAEQRAKISHLRLITVVIVMVIIIFFFHIYSRQRRKAYNKLNAKNHQLKLANERAEESSRMKAKFIRQISHEVRTPLNVLSGFSQVLTTPGIEIDYDELQSISHKIVENSERITKLVDKMLDLSLVNSDAAIECCDKVSPAEVATQAIDKSGIQKADHLVFQLQVASEAESISFVTNRKSAVKSLALLLDNAMKFTHPLAFKTHHDEHEKAQVVLSVNVDNDEVAFVVEDTGIGIPPEQAENIFTEFVQLDEYTDGTGIGLSIARSMARHMNGDITLDTDYTAGARFVMSLPLR